MILLLFGPPGCGKGTQAAYLAERFHIPAISTGEMFRAECKAGTELGKAACSILSSGGLVSDDLVARMKPGAALVDIAIDQGGCAETSRPTTHSNPTFVVDGVVHYCVANMPGAVANPVVRSNWPRLAFVSGVGSSRAPIQ